MNIKPFSIEKLALVSIFFSLYSHKSIAQVEPCYTPAVYYTAGVAPVSVTSADFNNDGNLDIAVANFNSSNLSVLFGSGTGAFAAAVDYAVDSGPFSITSADFNNDSNIDLATVDFYTGNVSVLLGSSAGIFSTAVSYPVGTSPKSITVADFNSDGNQDLAISNNGSDNISILIGSGTGAFSSPINYAVASTPESVITNDFNNDGNFDLAVVNSGSANVSILMGSGTGTFATAVNYATGSNPQSVAAADFNSDGNSDLAVCNGSTSTISILLGSSAGTFTTFITYFAGSFPLFVTPSDINNDGKVDLAMGNGAGNYISILMGLGAGTFETAFDITVGGGPSSIAPKDFNHDGMIDLAVANPNSSDLSILLNGIPNLIFSSPSSLCIGDSLSITVTGADLYTWNTGDNTDSIAVSPTVTATYTVTGTMDATGCESTAIKTITVNPLPIIAASSTNDTLCAGDTTSLICGSGLSTFTWSTGDVDVFPNISPNTSTSYSVIGTDVNGCSNSDTVAIIVNPLPSITVTTSDTLICMGQSATLTASGGNLYTWSTSDTGSVLIVSPSSTSVYTVSGASINGCVNVATVTQNVSTCTSIDDLTGINKEEIITIFPNPNNGSFNLTLNSNALIIVTNALGQTQMSSSLEAGNYHLALTDVANGIYFLKVIHAGSQVTKPLIINK